MDQIAQIKQQLDIVSVINGYVPLKKSGRNYKGVCPFHSENSPSFMVSAELQMYKCFGCGAAGDVFSFIQQIDGLDFSAALELLAEKAGIKLEKRSYSDEASNQKKQIYYANEVAAKFYNYLITKHEAGRIGLDYIKNKRKLTDQTVADFLVGYAPDNYSILHDFLKKKGISDNTMLEAGLIVEKEQHLNDKFRGRVVFPFMGIDGKIVGFNGRTILDRDPKYLNTSETLVFHKGSFIYGLDKAKLSIKKDGAIFVEGPMDVISAHQAGITNVIASSGTSLTAEQLKILSRYTKDITFCFDTDSAGVNAIFRGIELAESQEFNIKVAIIPSKYKDLDEMVKQDPNGAKDVFSHTVPAYDFFLYSIIKRYDKTSADGKKKIMDELIPRFSRITNKVLLDHYSKQIATELNLTEETVVSLLAKGYTEGYSEDFASVSKDTATVALSKQDTESYLISLLLKADLDTIKSIGYKLRPSDFSDERLSKLFKVLKDYAEIKRGKFLPQDFEKQLEPELAVLFSDLFLWEDLAESTDLDIQRTLESAVDRAKMQSARSRMKLLTQQIKSAEKAGDTENLIKLTEEFAQLKDTLK